MKFLLLAAALHGSALAEGECLPGALLKEGIAAIDESKFELAVSLCQSGLKKLGDSYQSAEVIDDTGQKLVAIELEFKAGRVGNAAVGYCRILDSRWRLFLSLVAQTRRPSSERPNPALQPIRASCAGLVG